MYLPFRNSNKGETTSVAKGGWDGPGWLYDAPNKTKQEHIEAGSLWPYIGEYEIYRCPMDPEPWDSGPTHALTSYLMSGEANGGNRVQPSYKIGRIRSDAIIFWEVDDSDNLARGYWNDGSNQPSEGLTVRHGEGATVAVIDGHTEWITHDTFYNDLLKQNPGPLYFAPWREKN